jgi:hypothetical protein
VDKVISAVKKYKYKLMIVRINIKQYLNKSKIKLNFNVK